MPSPKMSIAELVDVRIGILRVRAWISGNRNIELNDKDVDALEHASDFLKATIVAPKNEAAE